MDPGHPVHANDCHAPPDSPAGILPISDAAALAPLDSPPRKAA